MATARAMKRKRQAFVAAALVLAFGVLAPATAPGDTGGTNLPFRTKVSGYSYITLATGKVHAVFTIYAIHGGKGTLEENGQVIPTGQPGVFNWHSDYFSTNASDDHLIGECTGTITTSDGVHFLLSLNCVITEGTGHREGATGSMTATIHSERVSVEEGLATNRVEGTAVGEISFNKH